MLCCKTLARTSVICVRSEWWEGQSKRTGEVGEFPEIVFALQPLRTASAETAVPTSGGQAASQSNASVVGNASDRPLIDFGSLTSSDVTVTDGAAAATLVARFAHWTTFESTTDLPNATEEVSVPSTSDERSSEVVPTAEVAIRNCSDPLPTENFTSNSSGCGMEDFASRRHAMIDTGGGNAKFDEAEVDVSDSVLLLPVASHTSVSEPCSPAHGAGPGMENPDLRLAEETDTLGLCHSLPATNNFADRLSWMTSASCENLDSGVVPASHGHGLSTHAQFPEHLSKASSDSPVYVGNAPPVPPRDYPSCHRPADVAHQHQALVKTQSAQPHTEIHPIVQDGQRRSSTHYWLLPEKQRFDGLLPPPAPCGTDAETISYINVPNSSSGGGREKATRKNIKPKNSPPSASTAAETSRNAQLDDMMKKLDISLADRPVESMSEISDKVDMIRADVGFDAVTFEEALNALSLSHWSVEDAVEYIKIEHLFRLGIASRDVCREALMAFQWDLLKAASCLVDRQAVMSADHTL